jgi:hypothetical protein
MDSNVQWRPGEPPRPRGWSLYVRGIVAAGWATTVDNYLGRVTKPHILEVVREASATTPLNF